MANAFGIVYGIIFVAALVVLLDWYGQRRDGRSKSRPRT
jgi:hypothetical protein